MTQSRSISAFFADVRRQNVQRLKVSAQAVDVMLRREAYQRLAYFFDGHGCDSGCRNPKRAFSPHMKGLIN